MLRVLIADRLPDSARTRLQEAGCEVIVDPGLQGDTLTAALAEHQPDALIVRSTKVNAAHIQAGRSLQLIVRAGAGTNTIDTAAASARGVYVSNCPGMNAVAVAELTFAHILNADRRVSDGVADLRAGRWEKKQYSKARGLKGRTLGVIGAGNIGQAVIARALAFEMRVVAWSRSLTAARAAELGVTLCASAVEVARQADVLTVHLELSPATRGFCGPAIFEALRPGATFINTSRGELVDEEALAEAVRTKGVRAGLDVFHGEPAGDAAAWTPSLAALPGVYGTHHIGASTDQAQEAVADEAIRIVLVWAATGDAPNCVNLAVKTKATHLLIVRHEDRVGVLATVLDIIRQHNINVQQMENIIFSGARAASARIQLESAPPDALLDHLRAQDPVFDVKLVPLEVQ